MKKLITIVALALAGCSSVPNTPPETALVVEKQIAALSRAEVISATTECENAGMNALIMYGQRKVNGNPSHVVIDVTCVPSPRRFR